MLIPVSAAGDPPLSFADVIEHCRAPSDGTDDALLEGYLAAATQFAEKVSGLTIRQVALQYRAASWHCGRAIVLPVAPVRDVETIEYVDADGATQSVSSLTYTWSRTASGAVVTFGAGWSAPALSASELLPLRVNLLAGYDGPEESGSGADPALELPAVARTAILMLTAKFYEHRGDAESEDVKRAISSARELLALIKVYR